MNVPDAPMIGASGKCCGASRRAWWVVGFAGQGWAVALTIPDAGLAGKCAGKRGGGVCRARL